MRQRSMIEDLEEKLVGARDTIQFLAVDVETALRSRARWRSRAREEKGERVRYMALHLRDTEAFKKARAVDLANLASACTSVAELQKEVAARKEDEKALSSTLFAMRAELARLLTIGNGRPVVWVMGEVKRIHDLAGDPDEAASVPRWIGG